MKAELKLSICEGEIIITQDDKIQLNGTSIISIDDLDYIITEAKAFREYRNSRMQGERPPASKQVYVLKSKEVIIPNNFLISRFEYDKTLKKDIPGYSNTWCAELLDERVVIGYKDVSYYTTKAMVMSIPYPVPTGFLRNKGLPTSSITPLKAYRELLAKPAKPEPIEEIKQEKEKSKELSERTKKLMSIAEIAKKRWQDDKESMKSKE